MDAVFCLARPQGTPKILRIARAFVYVDGHSMKSNIDVDAKVHCTNDIIVHIASADLG